VTVAMTNNTGIQKSTKSQIRWQIYANVNYLLCDNQYIIPLAP